jgi:cytidine deaminase
MPCGACRQDLAEFAGPNLPIIVDGVGRFTLAELLPLPFRLRTDEEPTSSGGG